MLQPWTPSFTWIQPDLAVGGAFPIEQAACLVGQHGVGAIIDVRSETCDDALVLERCGLRFLHLPTDDMCGVSQPRLDQAVAFAEAAMAEGLRLLVHCQHGVGRSALVALCILIARGHAPLDALTIAKDARQLVSPSEAQYQAWARWIARRTERAPPSFHEFGMIAYRRQGPA
ncbi:dual specificity protein phosphatase family protein [Phenylobacterium sp. LjRoot219]|uniref:protein-tyrosine phosphatase family protein n=1 Tax=Phenylobacterium sp. LjRoot219 TaxID=3342283 RepID=UPI003ECFCCDA